VKRQRQESRKVKGQVRFALRQVTVRMRGQVGLTAREDDDWSGGTVGRQCGKRTKE
jgi:hypothetical protein